MSNEPIKHFGLTLRRGLNTSTVAIDPRDKPKRKGKPTGIKPTKPFNPIVYTRAFKLNHPNRCSFVRGNGEPCIQFKLKGSKFCYYHSKVYAKRRNTKEHLDDDMQLRFYSKRLGPKLNAFVEECLQQSESDQFNLTQELALARNILGEACELYQGAIDLPANNPHKAMRIAQAAGLMAQAMQEVRNTCKIGAEVFAASKDKYSVHTLVDVVSQIKKMIRVSFEHDEKGLQRFDRMLNEQLRLPKIGVDGTTITPDQDVLAMDDSIPNIVDSSAEEVISDSEELLLLQCSKCSGTFQHHDLNCVCPECNVPLQLVA